jgi:hypothetical protein
VTTIIGALTVVVVILATLAVDLLRAHGRVVRSLEVLDPLVDNPSTPLPLTEKPHD